MSNTDNNGDNKAKKPIPKGLKPFVKGDPRINRKGAPKRGQSWKEVIKTVTDMTAAEAIEYVGGEKSKVGRLLKELPADLPIKDALVLISIIHYGREPNARMLAALMDREDGKPTQPISGADGGDIVQRVIFEYATNENTIARPAQDAGTDKE
jgi:hypothetical protein